ncbi:hypothetical protein SAMN05421858_2993 [Haladaptatus litoreus]|uniref:DUF8118 domain-containing protein n=1 Tax=Haladaptatus litoreus TaxID=553468 RepID=A0A1N7CH41_9EURY|nr:hypothetical protein SAMN05421858_2993 [Haladaptatus litoreus]
MKLRLISLNGDFYLCCHSPTAREENKLSFKNLEYDCVDNITDNGTFDICPSDDERISGPYTGYDTYGTVDHTYWTCEDCSAEATRKGALIDCC